MTFYSVESILTSNCILSQTTTPWWWLPSDGNN